MPDPTPLLALRLCGQDHALEPGRSYLLGTAAHCDLRLPKGAAPEHARLDVAADSVQVVDLGSAQGTWVNGDRFADAVLFPGDSVRFGQHAAETVLVVDEGGSLLVPIPALRLAATARRETRARLAELRARHDGETLDELLARELRRSPWLGVSLFVHFALLLLLWVWTHTPPRQGERRAIVRLDPTAATTFGEAQPAIPAVVDEPSDEPPAPTPELELPPPTPSPPTIEQPTLTPRPELRHGQVVVVPTTTEPTAGSVPATNTRVPDQEVRGSPGFRRTVGELRRSGLEIVFVFDSTGSMAETIEDTKRTIAQMLLVLRTLVPDARIGLVTYRDLGAREEYLVRQIPLSQDFWRATNFVQFVGAAGGGDTPEAVREGLRTAFAQPWRTGARRVVVLAGDAPPHREDQKHLLQEVRDFARAPTSFVHTLITSPACADRDTRSAFQRIAEAGKGTCQDLGAEEAVLQRVLTLAFGSEFGRDIAAVIDAAEQEARRLDTEALFLAHRGGPALTAALHTNPVPSPLWNALVQRPRRATAMQLIDLLGAPDTPEPSRHAIAAALQRILDLPVPPIDAIEPTRPAAGELARLRRATARLPDGS